MVYNCRLNACEIVRHDDVLHIKILIYCFINKCQRLSKGQSTIDNPENLARQNTQDEDEQNKNTTKTTEGKDEPNTVFTRNSERKDT